MSRFRTSLTAGAVLALSAGTCTVPLAAHADPGYSVSVGAVAEYPFPTDTPAAPFLDRDGTFHFQQSAALYGKEGPRVWDFYTGTDFGSAHRDAGLSDAVNPAEPRDRNNDTTWRCNTSPTGREATDPPTGSSYTQKNFCDLVGTWVDPDTGDWYGLVHNEFTPEPFGAYSFSHYDAIDWAVSTDRGHTWRIGGHAITSPYSTKRGDTAAFPNQTFDYGDGDPRLFADPKSGYFYVYYGSRIVTKAGQGGGGFSGLAHVARAPMSGKMGTGTWQKWYDGRWAEPGVGGKESNLVPTDVDPLGYTPPEKDYDPARTGTAAQQVAAGTLPRKSDLFVMNIAYDAHLGLYIGEPEAVDSAGPQRFYATEDLANPKWRLIGDTGSYRDQSWYRWFVDSATRTTGTIVGKTFRSYCSISCTDGRDGVYADVTVTSAAPAASPVDPGRVYRIGSGRVLAASGRTGTTSVPAWLAGGRADWRFTPAGDGSYRIANAASGLALGVPTAPSGRAWGTAPILSAGSGAAQQWFLVPADGGTRLVNRYSGLVLALSAVPGRQSETTPVRAWTDHSGTRVGDGRTAGEQLLQLTPRR
ncbi:MULTISPECIES: RICIN domain-containing protein [Amycolatopsis]|uniref:RICIN domain-containing protein n=1 Tax=Amycolatopsis dendrobii TaxID=2760662 RepID=A0A7W3Z872_9PSEU|nr:MULTISPECIES: RICIN domain-containing protein [Amycolatopsis]MBB1151512.1 RICIN domain-containing protein [Amycolatopsis dendrobii]UKD58272.1 RICIN domain-containing protein [Amycolatopsis sp. FU40]